MALSLVATEALTRGFADRATSPKAHVTEPLIDHKELDSVRVAQMVEVPAVGFAFEDVGDAAEVVAANGFRERVWQHAWQQTPRRPVRIVRLGRSICRRRAMSGRSLRA
jgi:hypothetical protein